MLLCSVLAESASYPAKQCSVQSRDTLSFQAGEDHLKQSIKELLACALSPLKMERENYLLFKIYLDVTFTAEFCPGFLFSKKHFEFRCWIVMK